MDGSDNGASVEDLQNSKSCAFNLDYDSGYISHKSESNLDNFMRDGDVLSLVSDPIYISENALLEMPITCNISNIRKEIEKENFDETNVFNSPLLSASTSTSRVSPSSGSDCSPELNYFGFASEESNISPQIPCANQITVGAEYIDNILNNMQGQNQNGLVKNPVFNNITNTYATSDPLKKLTLVLSKSDKENSYIVTRKYRSLSPIPDDTSNYHQGGSDEGTLESNTNACLKCVKCNADIIDDEEQTDLILPKNINNSSYETMQLSQESFITIENANCDANLLRKCNATSSVSFVSNDSEIPTDQNINKVVSETLNCIINNIHNREEMINASLILSTPEKSYNSNNSALSPDLFSEDSPDKSYFEEIDPVKLIPQEKYVLKKDEMILKRTQNHLKGVLPPRSVTTIKISIEEILSKLECNKKYFWDSSTSSGSICEGNSKSLLVSSSTENSKKMDFPDVLQHRALGLYHNRNKTSEEFEELCMKYGQRYVGTETLSSCTVFEMNALSPMKRRNMKSQWNSKSPGKRLSHLARRRITFSSSNLQSGSSFAGSRARQILVDAKKMDLLNRRKSPRKTPRKNTPKKSPKTKTRTPSSSAKKKLAMRFRKMAGEIQKTSDSVSLAAKRTLFHSPDKYLPSTSAASTSVEDTRLKSKRVLFSSPSKRSPLKNLGFKRSPVKRLDFGTEKKRKRLDSESYEEVPSKFPKSQSEFTLSNDSSTKMLSSRTRSDLSLHQTRQIKELTITHKKKLQLAIYEALRSQSVLPTHPKFKALALNLGRLTRQLFLLTANDSVGVTEKLLRIARHHVIAIVKGKSPEEIYEEFLRQKSKNAKPQGYVAPENSVPEAKPASLVRSSAGSKNIDRIKKVIDF